MNKRLLLFLFFGSSISVTWSQQAHILGNCFYDNTSNRITIRIGIVNNTSSNVNLEYIGQRFGFQYNSSAVTYTGYRSFMYKFSDQNSGINAAEYINFIGADTGPSPAVGTETSPTRIATIQNSALTKTMQRKYINRSTGWCFNIFNVPPNQMRLLLDIYFTLNNPAQASFYNLNQPGYGFGTADFIAQFFTKNNGDHNAVLESSKVEIGVIIIRQGNTGNPYQPFDMSACNEGSVNPISVSGDDINFISPIEGVLSGEINNLRVSQNNETALLKWEATADQRIEYFAIERRTGNGEFNVITTLEASNQHEKVQYSYSDPLNGAEQKIEYRIVAKYINGVQLKSNIVQLVLMKKRIAEVQVWPNPAESIVKINGEFLKGNYQVKIISLTGQVIISVQRSASDMSFDVSALKPGQYIAEITHLQTGGRSITKFTKR
jgi:hypothetical protein